MITKNELEHVEDDADHTVWHVQHVFFAEQILHDTEPFAIPETYPAKMSFTTVSKIILNIIKYKHG